MSLGEDTPTTVGEIGDRLRGGRWTKLIAAGDTVSASVRTPVGPWRPIHRAEMRTSRDQRKAQRASS